MFHEFSFLLSLHSENVSSLISTSRGYYLWSILFYLIAGTNHHLHIQLKHGGALGPIQ
jgi:hypothetical protein